jgi:hypothetical protein
MSCRRVLSSTPLLVKGSEVEKVWYFDYRIPIIRGRNQRTSENLADYKELGMGFSFVYFVIVLSRPSSGVTYKYTWFGLIAGFIRFAYNSNNLQSQ